MNMKKIVMTSGNKVKIDHIAKTSFEISEDKLSKFKIWLVINRMTMKDFIESKIDEVISKR